MIKRSPATSGYFFPGHTGSPSLTMRTKTVKPTRRLGGSSPAIENIPSSPGGENSEIINILNVKSCYAWDTHTVQCSWHLHLKQFDIQEDALTLWIFSVLRPHYKGPACHFILLTLNYVNDNQLQLNHNAELLAIVSLQQVQTCLMRKF